MVNNMVFGMTGGQVSPTTPENFTTRTTPYGNYERPLDTCKIVANAGASYVARWTTTHVFQLKDSIKRALLKVMNGEGMAFIEVVSQCPTRLGHMLGSSAPEMMKLLHKLPIDVKKYYESPNQYEGRIPIGIYVDREDVGYVKRYYKIIEKVKGENVGD